MWAIRVLVLLPVLLQQSRIHVFASESIVVSIREGVPQEDCVTLLEKLQILLTLASDSLHKDTAGNVYFEKVAILIPTSWQHRSCGDFSKPPFYTSREHLSEAAIHINGRPDSLSREPFLAQPGVRCGDGGQYVSVGYEFIRNLTVDPIKKEPVSVEEAGGVNNTNSSLKTDVNEAVRDFVHQWKVFRSGEKYRLNITGSIGADWKNCASAISIQRKLEPEFIVMQVPTPTFILLTGIQGCNESATAMRYLIYAARKFIRYDLPYGSRVGLVHLNGTGGVLLSKLTTLDSITHRRALLNLISKTMEYEPGRCSYENFTLNVGITASIDMVQRYQSITAGTVIILVTPANVSEIDRKDSSVLLKQHEMSLASIYYPSNGTGNIHLLSDIMKGLHFNIRGPDSRAAINNGVVSVQLVSAFYKIQRHFSENLNQISPVLIHQEEYAGELMTHANGNFSHEQIEGDSPPDFWIFGGNVHWPNINFQLTSPTGLKYKGISGFKDINMAGITATINETGIWQYSFERVGVRKESHFVQVVGKPHSDHFSIEIFTNARDNFVNLTTSPLTLFVKILHLGRPVVGADVFAFINTGKQTNTLRIFDNGFGDPDMIVQDGVYSGYFLSSGGISNTLWQISVKAVVNPVRGKILIANINTVVERSDKPYLGHICNRLIVIPSPSNYRYETAPFWERFLPALALMVTGVSMEFYTPAHIGDLKVSNIHGNKLMAELLWTSPSLLFQRNKAAYYHVLSTVDRGDQPLEHWRPVKLVHALKKSGMEERIVIYFPSQGMYRIAIKGESEGKVGKPSNAVRIAMYHTNSLSLNSTEDIQFDDSKTGRGASMNSAFTNTLPRMVINLLIVAKMFQ